jgi:pimeloyl-ACP methyl ester carboxylesterase
MSMPSIPSQVINALALPTVPYSERSVSTNGIHLHVVEAGPQTGLLVLLLHGFPEFWRAWGKQIDRLAGAGFRVWAVDQRGYNLSDKPTGVDAYNLHLLSDDVIGLLDAAGAEQAAVVGHDWGAAVAWWTANRYPGRVSHLVPINVPHPVVLMRQLRSNWRQRLRSSYIAFFQIPALPEALLRASDWGRLARTVQGSARPGVFGVGDMVALRGAWSQPGAISAMLNWYRAVRQMPRLPTLQIEPRTLIIWGAQDNFIGREAAVQSAALCTDARLEFVEDATHWVHHEESARVGRLLLDFLTK